MSTPLAKALEEAAKMKQQPKPSTPLAAAMLPPLQIPNIYMQNYQTYLPPDKEQVFRNWVAQNHVPFDPNDPKSDYDMRAYWMALNSGDPITKQSLNSNDGRMHFTDKFKTPYHESFSNESMYALPDTPGWNNKDQLVDKYGRIWFDERAKNKR